MTRVASAQGTPAPLAAYLRRATWGLPPERQQELWDELEDHVLTRADRLALSGLSPEDALSQALRDLGPPTRVSAGMTQVYLMPKLILTASAAALALSAALYALAGGGNDGNIMSLPVITRTSPTSICTPDNGTVLQFPVISRKNGATCYQVSDTFKENGALISVSVIRPAVEALGGKVNILPDGLLEIRMPNGTWSRRQPAFKGGGESYIFANSFISALISLRPQGLNTEVSIGGYRNPVLKIGGQIIRFDAVSDPKIGRGLYSDIGGETVDELFYPGDAAHSFTTQHGHSASPQHRIQTGLPAGEVVTLVQRTGENEFFTASGEVQADGTVEVGASSSRVRFVASPKLVALSGGNGRTSAVLVRVTNVPLDNLKSGIFLPAQPTSDAN